MSIEPSLVCAARGRQIKFTPERLEQIKNLVERGLSREDIATTIGVTVGSLQVTCSRLGISLRRPKPKLLVVARPENGEKKEDGGNGNPAGAPSLPFGERATISLVLRRGEREKRVELPLPDDVVTRIALEAAMNGESFATVVARLIVAGDKKR